MDRIGHVVSSLDPIDFMLPRGPMALFTFRILLSASAAAGAALALASAASPPARADPAAPYDRCAYMNHDSKAYKACIADEAAARERADAAPVSVPKPKPEAQPKS